MPEVLARMRREPTLSAPTRDSARAAPRGAKAAAPKAPSRVKWRNWAPRTLGGYAGIFMVVALSAIVVNAVGLQRERHPAPLFAPTPAPASTSSAPVAAPAASAPKLDVPSPPVAKPLPAALPSVGRKTDPIGEFLRTGPPSDNAKTVVGVQRALMKLGYDLQADGLMGATTLEALHDFEKAHGLPATNELSPHLIAKLAGAGR